jgi:diaminopimelate decarboxylase
MKYLNSNFFIEKVKAQSLSKKFGTPIYCYSYERIKKNIINFKKNFRSFEPLICFSVKANNNVNILREIRKFSCGADVVSIGELMKALKAGFSPKKIVFSGVGKKFDELSYAINRKILLINIESKSELLEVEKIAKSKKISVDIGIRLNPNTDARTLKKISTGKKENKFGLTENFFLDLVNYSKNSKYLNLKCLSVHIGSQIVNNKPYEKTLAVINKIIKKSNYKFDYVDLGGGMGIPYENNKKLNYKKYNNSIKKFLKINKTKIIFEPGRSIIGDTAVLISKVIYIKKTKNKDFIVLDSAMNDLIRPALYGSNHKIIPLKKSSYNANKNYEFVGPICETTDKFLNLKNFQKLNQKDLVAICDVGAYGMSLSSNYNVRPKPIEILIKGSKLKVIKKRQKLKDLI